MKPFDEWWHSYIQSLPGPYTDRKQCYDAFMAGQKSIACCGACKYWYSLGGDYDCRVDQNEPYPGIDAYEGPCSDFKPRGED